VTPVRRAGSLRIDFRGGHGMCFSSCFDFQGYRKSVYPPDQQTMSQQAEED